MDTGVESPAIIIEPVEIPVPGYSEPAPAEREPSAPVEQEPEPVEEPVLVPA